MKNTMNTKTAKSFRQSMKCLTAVMLIIAAIAGMCAAFAEGDTRFTNYDIDCGDGFLHVTTAEFGDDTEVQDTRFTNRDIDMGDGCFLHVTTAEFDDETEVQNTQFTNTVIDMGGCFLHTTTAEF